MGMGGMDKNLVLCQTGSFANCLHQHILHRLTNGTQVRTHQQDFVLSNRQCQRIDLQLIQNTLSIPGMEITNDFNAQRRGDIHTTKAGSQCVHYVPTAFWHSYSCILIITSAGGFVN